MLAHGANPDELDEDIFRQVVVMYADGQIGNHGVVETIGSLTTGVYNYIREPNKPAYKLQEVIGKRFYEYLYPSQKTTKEASEALLVFMTQAEGFNLSRFGVDK
jgi:hypothetical protein